MMQFKTIPLVLVTAVILAAAPARSQTTVPAASPAAGGPTLKTTANDAFNKFFIAQINPLWSPGYNDFVDPKLEWKVINAEVAKATDPVERKRREDLVAFWKAIIRIHDHGMNSVRPASFESKSRMFLLGGKFPRMGASLDFDLVPYRRYLMQEELPDWAARLKFVVAGILAGDGDRDAMALLAKAAAIEYARVYQPRTADEWSFFESQLGARTEKALPLWKEQMEGKDDNLRLWATRNVAAIPSAQATQLLQDRLKDPTYAIRRAAAVALMDREVKDCTSVLMEVVLKEMSDTPRMAVTVAPLCIKLDQWKVPNIPWSKLEYHLNEKIRADNQSYSSAITLAGQCIQAGRTKLAVPFLVGSLKSARGGDIGPDNKWAWQAANTLFRAGRGEALPLVTKYFEAGGGEWAVTADILRSMGEYLRLGKATPEERQAILDMAAKTFARRNKLLGDYCGQGFEALGDMGGVVRVRMKDGRPETYELVPLVYTEKYGINPLFAMDSILKAKVNSLVASAAQDNITLPPKFVAEYKETQFAMLRALAAGPAATKPANDAAAEIQVFAREALDALEASDWGN